MNNIYKDVYTEVARVDVIQCKQWDQCNFNVAYNRRSTRSGRISSELQFVAFAIYFERRPGYELHSLICFSICLVPSRRMS
jgi:hypothetical protein